MYSTLDNRRHYNKYEANDASSPLALVYYACQYPFKGDRIDAVNKDSAGGPV